MKKIKQPLDAKTQHNCQVPKVLFHFSYILFFIFGVFLSLISG